jgi:hypothetical protein
VTETPPLDYSLISQAAAAAFAAARLLHFRLRRRYPLLFSWLLASALSSAIFSALDIRAALFYTAYMVWQPISWIVAALAVREMFALIFRDYPGLQTVGRWALYGALGLSVGTAILLSVAFPRPGSLHSRTLRWELVLDRSVEVSLAIVVVFLMAVLSRYPLRLEWNTYVSSGFFSALFLASGTVKLIDSVSPHLHSRLVDHVDVAFEALCLVGWGVLLRAGDLPKEPRPPANKAREAELLQQLKTLNDLMSRSVSR